MDRTQVIIEACDEMIFHELPRRYQLRTPQCDRIWERFYADPVLETEQAAELGAELAALAAAHRESVRQDLARRRQVHAKDPRVATRILDQMLSGDPVLAKCDEIRALCEEASRARHGLRSSSD